MGLSDQKTIEDLDSFLQKFKIPLIFGLFGLLFLGLGFLTFKFFLNQEEPIKIISQEERQSEKTMMIDLEGAVEKPGVYELQAGSRINDLLVKAGGLSAKADREWVAKNLNLAQKLTDGAKIYIPTKQEINNGKSKVLAGAEDKTNLNTASAAELDKLWGIGPATAQKIIESRPYQKIEDLINKKIVKSNVWEAIKDQITVY